MNGTPLGVWQQNPILNNVNIPDYVIPTPPPARRYTYNNIIYKGFISCKSTHFPLVYSYPKQGYTKYQKTHSERYTIPFSQVITLKKRAWTD